MTVDDAPAHDTRILRGTNGILLLLAMILLIVGFPFFLFGVFLALSQGPDGMGDVAFGFGFGGCVAVMFSLGIREYLRRRDGWF